jgi:hypothetical protein
MRGKVIGVVKGDVQGNDIDKERHGFRGKRAKLN